MPSLAMVMNRRLDHDVASDEPREIELKVLGAFADMRLHGRGQLKIARGYLNGALHLKSPSSASSFETQSAEVAS